MKRDIAQRLRLARTAAGYRTAKEFASSHGVPQPTYALHESGERGLRPDVAERYATLLGVSPAWLLTGEGQGPLGTVTRPEPVSPADAQGTTAPDDETDGVIPEIDVRAGLGAGGEALLDDQPDGDGGSSESDRITGLWELPPDYLRQELRIAKGAARIVAVQGDSMEPTLLTGDRVMIHLPDRFPSPPGVFALWDGFGVVVKRLEFVPNSDPPRITISSDNPRHGRYERTAGEVNIIGRVVWFARRM
ncbi:XRE family transcriptional regulator [Azospirillum doebereinerae]|uniref:XRE family transcriptional regulator n=1 Tax=Azospirillum doebereinerae TaxID=92933 RepID=A0A433J240_9PROT|nr:XRE family transcriptional regulator [Azospirillum doebereinerae]MCG5241893.1 helix-turn-helix domain-containing protein [Azospirillum doebereinerae]RUQ65167.1 XRE family transcriptional regulator [Azospirillum doebereinerae]